MPRFRDQLRVELNPRARLAAAIGPTDFDEVSDEELLLVWHVCRDELMNAVPAGTRPWAWWTYVAREPMPEGSSDAETLRLAQLGALTDSELAALREKANEARLRIGTPAERLSAGQSMDQRDVELFEAVAAA